MDRKWQAAVAVAQTLVNRYFTDWQEGKEMSHYYASDADLAFCGDEMKGKDKIFEFFKQTSKTNMEFLATSYETQPIPGTNLLVMVVTTGTCTDPTSESHHFLRDFHSAFYVSVDDESAVIKSHKFDLFRRTYPK